MHLFQPSPTRFVFNNQGILSLQMLGQLSQLDGDTEKEAELLGIPEEFLPLPAPILNPEALDSWEKVYAAKNLDLDSPMAFVLHYPLTIFYILSKHILPTRLLPLTFRFRQGFNRPSRWRGTGAGFDPVVCNAHALAPGKKPSPSHDWSGHSSTNRSIKPNNSI